LRGSRYLNSALSFQNPCKHATAIAANNGSHKKFFDDTNKNYEQFYEFVNSIMCCSFASVGCAASGRSVPPNGSTSGGEEQPRGNDCWAMEASQ
jgi:hypothetical protein